ncbi:hypothetical protein BH24CHL7_BH24CHL7_14640 [soil metagenome]|jgi:hypothetical protein
MTYIAGPFDWTDDARTIGHGYFETDMRPGRLRVWFEVRTDRRSRGMRIANEVTGEHWATGLRWARLRWTPGDDGPEDLHLSWPDDPNVPVNHCEVSDVLALARDPKAQRAVRAFFDALPKVGRPAGMTTIVDDEDLKAPVREMRRDHVRRITVPALASRAGFTVADVRGYLKVTGRTLAEFLDTF